jgi:hypothetical protein
MASYYKKIINKFNLNNSDRHKNILQQQIRQWEQIDRPRLVNMMFLPENQDDVKNATLSQILDKIQQNILDNHKNTE